MTTPAKKRRSKKPKGPSKTKWEKSADRENERRFKKAPLFVHAGLVPLATPEEREARFGDAFRKRLDEEDEERKRAEAERAAAQREDVRALVTAEQFAELEVRAQGWTGSYSFYGNILDGLRRAAERAGPTQHQEAVARANAIDRQAARRQLPIFVDLPDRMVPAVAEGRSIPLEDIAAEHGLLDVERPELVTPGPCAGCGWEPRARDPLALNVHDPGCPHMRAFILGLWENCADCRAQHARMAHAPYGTCDAHLARTIACQRDGCVPGGAPPKDYGSAPTSAGGQSRVKGHPLDLTGKHYGAVEVLRRAGTTPSGTVLWSCWCHACGRPWTMRGHVLRRGVNSCGCLRGGRGEANPQARLTWPKVAEIRARWAKRFVVPVSQGQLALAYGVSRRLIGMVVRGEVWVGEPARTAA